LSESTFVSRRCYLNQLVATAKRLGMDQPCQELFDVFTAEDHGSDGRRFQLERCVKVVDGCAGTHAVRHDGRFYNEPVLPAVGDVQALIDGAQFPVENLDVGVLIVKTEVEMSHVGLSESTMGQYRHAWMDVYRFFYGHGSTVYDQGVVEEFIRQATMARDEGRMMEWKWKINRKAALVLVEVASTGRFAWSLAREPVGLFDPGLDQVRRDYLSWVGRRGVRPATVSLHDYVFRGMVTHANITGTARLWSVSPEDVTDMVAGFASVCNRRSLSTVVPIIRAVLGFLHSHGHVERCLSGMVMAVFTQKGNVAAYLCGDDEARIVAQLEHESKRDKAIVLLGLRLGLRDSDICGLRFDQIDWDQDMIRLVQKKTGVGLTLPLVADVGNAVMDYLCEERPSTRGCPFVFVRKQAPHVKLVSTYTIFARIARRVGVAPVNGTVVGARLYRYTLAHRLLAAGTPHQVITGVLGHTSKESDKPYLSMDVPMLRMCALDLSVVGTPAWAEVAR